MVQGQSDFKEWLDANPLVVARKQNGDSLTTAAAKLQVAIWTVQKWQFGTSTPSDESFEKLAEYTGNQSIAAEWSKWLKEIPRGGDHSE